MAETTLLKGANVVVFLFFAFVTAYSMFSKVVMADIFRGHETYFDPARWLFLAWSVIHFLLLGFVAYQWTQDAHDIVIDDIGWHFVVLALLNSLWFSLLESNHPILAFVVSILLLLSVSVIFYRLAERHEPTSWRQKLLIQAPFSLWHGFALFTAVLNAFVAFTTVRKDQFGLVLPPNILHVVLVYAALLVLTLSAIGYVHFKHEHCDVTSALVIAFGLWAIFDKQDYPLIRWPVLAAALVTTLWPIEPFLQHQVLKYRSSVDDPAQAPILPDPIGRASS